MPLKATIADALPGSRTLGMLGSVKNPRSHRLTFSRGLLTPLGHKALLMLSFFRRSECSSARPAPRGRRKPALQLWRALRLRHAGGEFYAKLLEWVVFLGSGQCPC